MENKSRSVLKVIIVVLLVCLVIGIGVFFINRKGKNMDGMEELKDFDMTVSSYLDLMPPVTGNEKASFSFLLEGIDKDSFLNNYEIDSVELNETKISNQEIRFGKDTNAFGFNSSNYKDINTIVLIVKNKNTNKKYYKEIQVKTIKVY